LVIVGFVALPCASSAMPAKGSTAKRKGDAVVAGNPKKNKEAAPTNSLAVIVKTMIKQLGASKVKKLKKSIDSFDGKITVCSLCSGSEIQGFSFERPSPNWVLN
jgi:hypothetical protein